MKKLIQRMVEKDIDNMFCKLADKFNLRTGDFAPDQEFDLTKIKKNLEVLFEQYVEQNITINRR